MPPFPPPRPNRPEPPPPPSLRAIGGVSHPFREQKLEGLLVEPQRGDERLLGDLDAADALHAPLALLLALEQLALAGDVTAVALGDDVLAPGLHRLARDDAP